MSRSEQSAARPDSGGAAAPQSTYRTIAWLMIPNAALFMTFMGLLQVLLPSHIALLDPAHKIELLGSITGMGALFATCANPVAGALSDRTRTRFGRRAPWLFGCALGVALALAMMAAAHTIAVLTLAFCLVQVLANGFQAAISAALPERVPVARRGLASSAVGVCFPLGIILGSALAAYYAADVASGYLALAALFIGAALLYLGFNPEAPSVVAPRPGRGLAPRHWPREFLSALAAHDFRWTFISRFLSILTFALISGFQLYMLQDYIALPAGRTGADVVLALNAVQMPCMILTTMLGGPVSDYFGGRRKIFVLWAAFGMGVALLLLLLSPDMNGVYAFAVVNGLSFGLYMGVDTALITQVLPDPRNVARDLGILNIATAGPQIIAPFIGAHIVSAGGYPALLLAGAGAAALGAVSVLKLRGVR
jgi:MFS family permease